MTATFTAQPRLGFLSAFAVAPCDDKDLCASRL